MLKPTRSFRLLVGISGLLGVAALAVYYSVPIPVPPPNAGFREIAEFGTQFHDKILLDAWLQGIGSLLVVIFFLALVYLAQGIERFSGWITTLGATTSYNDPSRWRICARRCAGCRGRASHDCAHLL
jgi:hypothetical protein